MSEIERDIMLKKSTNEDILYVYDEEGNIVYVYYHKDKKVISIERNSGSDQNARECNKFDLLGNS